MKKRLNDGDATQEIVIHVLLVHPSFFHVIYFRSSLMSHDSHHHQHGYDDDGHVLPKFLIIVTDH